MLFILMPLSKCNSLSEGESYIYDIVSASYYAEYGTNKASLDSYRFGALKYPIGTKINASVEDVEAAGNVKFRFWVGNISSIAFFTADWFDLLADELSYRTLYFVYGMIEDFDEIFVAEISLYQIRPYVNLTYSNYVASPSSLGEDICYFFSKWFYRYP